MLYDLNVPWTSTQSPLELQRTISFLSELGYDTLALNYTITGPIPPLITNLIPTNQPFTIPTNTILLRRVTIPISDPAHNHRLPSFSSVYDILALRPTTEKAFLAACTSLTEHSLISLDLTSRFDFSFKPKPLMAAVHRGIKFEICYAQATMEDAGKRRNFISNCLGIFRATRGRGIVVSSEAKSVLGVRGPADVVNLLAVWGLGREMGLESLGVNPRGVVINEGLKRTSFRGVVDVIDGGERAVEKEKGEKEIVKNGTKAKGKRKVDEVVENVQLQTISKRQAKKIRLEALKAAKESSSPVKNADSKETASSKDGISSKEPPKSDTPSTTKIKEIS